ncbi:MAG TPA: class I adenylate-forming enzyme family protein [Acidimicrobiales bacterium]|nr:class I adenylate-forming enzyme family protein [Acidimicrobiales bacterium]
MPLPDLDYAPTIPAVVRRAATTFGDNDFIVMSDRRMSYGEAEVASRRVGKQLLAAGVGKGTRIGFMFPYGTDWVVAWLATARIGAIGMPFSTSYKPAELRKALRFGDVDTLLVPSRLFGQDHLAYVEDAVPGLAEAGPEPLRIPALPFLRHVRVSGPSDRLWAKALPLDFRLGDGASDPGNSDLGNSDPGAGDVSADDDSDGISDELFEAVEAEVTPSDLMMTIFTSGTTSEPKGVVHTHGNFLRHGANLARFAGLTSESRRLCAMPFFWIGGVGLSLNIALSIGSAILCVEKFEPDAVLDLMEAEGATELAVWPQLGQRMQRYIVETGRDVSKIPAFAPPPTTDFGLRHNSLGMTETMGPHSAAGPEAERVLPEEMRGSFGLLVPCVEHRIADPETNATLDEGEEGEVCIRGYSVMNGLYKRERHETFDEDGWYHTGDKGLIRDGYLYFHGRLSELIKTSGSNVAPREVEALLESFPEVGLAVVVGLPDANRGEVVAAALVPAAGASIDPIETLRRAGDELSNYKVPRRVLVLDEGDMPHLANGKPDRLTVRKLVADRATEVRWR